MDLNALNESKLGMFREAIDKQADDEIKEQKSLIRERKSAAGAARAELDVREKLAKIHAEQSAAEAKFKKEFSRCDFEIAQAVRLHRKELIDGFFADIESELSRFSESENYEKHLKAAIAKAESELGSDFVILARERDVEILKKLTNREVRADRSIKLGGICALDESRGLFCDYSLDKALNDEKNAFSGRSELRL